MNKKLLYYLLLTISIHNLTAGYDECDQAWDECVDNSAVSACEAAGGVWTGRSCWGKDNKCKNKCYHGIRREITTAKGCGLCHFEYDSVKSPYSNAGQFKAGADVAFAATFVHGKFCNVQTGDAAKAIVFDQEKTDKPACKNLYWNNPGECPK